MRNILLSFCLAFLASTAHATTIDFEEFANSSGTGSVITQDFKLTSTYGYYSIEPFLLPTKSYNWSSFNILTLEKTNGELFAIESADIATIGNDLEWFPKLTITGYRSDGVTLQIYGIGATTFGSEWTNLERIEFNALQSGISTNSIDNIVVSTVPVPPAIWLFASALFGLMRWRKRALPTQ
jgi:hypothetical protein